MFKEYEALAKEKLQEICESDDNDWSVGHI
jgi:hypothetical protein